MRRSPDGRLYEDEKSGRRFIIKDRCKYAEWEYAFFELFRPGPKAELDPELLPLYRSHSDYISENGTTEVRETGTKLLRFYFDGPKVYISEQLKPRTIIRWRRYESETRREAEAWLVLEFPEENKGEQK